MLRQLRPILAEGQDDLKLVAPPAEESFPKRALSGGGTWPFGCHRNANRRCNCAQSDELLSNWVAPVARVYYRRPIHQTEYLMPPARRADLTFRRLQDRSLRPCHFKPGNSAFRIVGKADPVDPIC
jgi:hypothetical protein